MWTNKRGGGEIKPAKYSQNVYSTLQNDYGTVMGRKFISHLILGVTKDLTKSIRVQLDTASYCNTLPERLAQSLIPDWAETKQTTLPLAKQPYSPIKL